MRKMETRVVTRLLGTLILVVAGFGFTYKFVEFVRTIWRGDIPGFGIVPVLSYLTVGIGFLLLLIWSMVAGHLKDIEGPKYRMLEQEEEYERQEKARYEG